MACGQQASIEGQACPCSDGYSCCAATNLCVANGATCGNPSRVDGGETGSDGGDTLPGPAPGTYLRIFVTSDLFKGDLGGLAGADAKCAATAQRASLGGNWVAFLSDSSTAVLDRVKGEGPWYLLDQQTLAFPSHASLAIDPRAWIKLDESGQKYSPAYVWTGTNPHDPPTSCANWTTTSGKGTYVYAGSIYENITDDDCSNLHSLICLEQP